MSDDVNYETLPRDIEFLKNKLEKNKSNTKKFANIFTFIYFLLVLFLSTKKDVGVYALPFLVILPIYFIINYLFRNLYFSLYGKKIIKSIMNLREYKNIVYIINQSILNLKGNISFWKQLSWQEFELATADRLNELGLIAENTGFSNDEGVDVILKIKNQDILIQCKKYNSKVGTPYIRNLIGSMKIKNSYKGVVITTGPGYSKNAIELAAENNILLLDLVDFLNMNKGDFENI